MFNFGASKRIKQLEAENLDLKKSLDVISFQNDVRGSVLTLVGFDLDGLEYNIKTLALEIEDDFSVVGRGIRNHIVISRDFTGHTYSNPALVWINDFFDSIMTRKARDYKKRMESYVNNNNSDT